jgi:ectoine hydroxylase-related dioxygenase (phytanoyl-CoA dioxygenase family)
MSITSDSDRRHFDENGILLLKGFYDVLGQIEPILEGIRCIIEILCRKYHVEAPTHTAHHSMTEAFMALIRRDRAYGSEVYDAVKQIPEFMQLVSDARNSLLFRELRDGSIPGLAAGGFGIRIDCPGEATFKAPWHQEFPAQLRSLDGLVYWTPLVSIRPSLGPVEVCIGSHRDGIIPVHNPSDSAQKGAYALRLVGEAERLARYQHQSPLTEPGDLLMMDFLTLHQSGENIDVFPRWSIQFRYFNYADPLGVKISWKGSFAGGQDFRAILSQVGVAI